MNYLHIIKNKWQTITVITLSVVVLSLIFSLIQPLEYRSRVELLIIQKQSLSMDAYAAARASEKLASNLANVIETKSFFDKVITGNFGIKKSSFPTQEKELRKEWQEKINTVVIPETSLLRIDIFDKNKKEANKIASAVAVTLINSASEYHGSGSDVTVKVVNAPLVSERPVKPNVVLNAIMGLVVGLIFSLGTVLYKANQDIRSLVGLTQDEAENFDPQLNDEIRKEKIRNVFQPQIKTMYDQIK